MLGVSRYSKDYIDATKARVKGDVNAYEQLVASAKSSGNGFDAAREAFESRFYNSMVLALENSFVHRLRTVEGKDGNPLNEVRVLCQSILEHGGVMTADKTIKLQPERSVSKLQYGEPVKLDGKQFGALSDVFFAAIETRFGG